VRNMPACTELKPLSMRSADATLKFLLLLAVSALAACGKQEPAVVAPAPVMSASFECPVPESLQGKVESVFLPASRVGEPPEKGWAGLEGDFEANSVDLTLPSGSSVSIKLDEPVAFAVMSQAHTGCEQFKWKSLGDVTLFEYIHGAGNPYPAQQLMYSRGSTPKFMSLWALLGAGDVAFYEGVKDRPGCLAGLAKGDGEVERWCYADGKLEQTRKMFKVSHPEGEFRYTCDFSGDGPLMIEASIRKPGADPVPLGVEYTAAIADFTDECMRAKVILEAKEIDEE